MCLWAREADVSMISSVKMCIDQGKQSILVRSDDTDVFVLFVYFFWKWQSDTRLKMKRLVDGKFVDIHASATRFGEKREQLLAVNALTGCDTVSYPCGKGKATTVSVLMKNDDLGLDIFWGPTSRLCRPA